MHLIDGRALAEKILEEVKRDVERLGASPRLAVLLVGDDPASHLYVRLKRQAAERVGIRVDVQARTAATSDDDLIVQIENWNRDPDVQAILVQLPLPLGHNEDRVIAAIDPAKDVDGFHPANVSALLDGKARIIPPVHEGILCLIGETPLRVNGASALILANSTVFATPLKRLLESAGLRVTLQSPDAVDEAALKSADVIVIAVGRAGFLKPNMVKNDAVIIDVGTNKTAQGKTVGDADLVAFKNTDVWITPVPGGVGPMTIAQLLKNVAKIAGSA